MNDTPKKDEVQGEGDYDAARRYDKAQEEFNKSGKVDEAMRNAAPKTPQEAEEMKRAEEIGKSHSKGEDKGMSDKSRTRP